jgi:hypothetical protein
MCVCARARVPARWRWGGGGAWHRETGRLLLACRRPQLTATPTPTHAPRATRHAPRAAAAGLPAARPQRVGRGDGAQAHRVPPVLRGTERHGWLCVCRCAAVRRNSTAARGGCLSDGHACVWVLRGLLVTLACCAPTTHTHTHAHAHQLTGPHHRPQEGRGRTAAAAAAARRACAAAARAAPAAAAAAAAAWPPTARAARAAASRRCRRRLARRRRQQRRQRQRRRRRRQQCSAAGRWCAR